MGAESYLIEVIFKSPVPQTDIINLLADSGSIYLDSKSNTEPVDSFRDFYFEIRSDLGLTELKVLLPPNEQYVHRFFLRFSILSPNTVIDQSIDFLKNLRNKMDIKVLYADGSSNKLELNIEKFKLNKRRNRILKTIISNENGLVIEGGDTTTHFIYENNLVDKVWGRKEKATHNNTLPQAGRKWWQKLFGN
jgi:hypothetical protein